MDTNTKLERSLLGRINPNDVTEDYELGRVLGRGQFGTTRLSVQKSTGQQCACKSILKKRLIGIEDIANVKQELEIMFHLEGESGEVQGLNCGRYEKGLATAAAGARLAATAAARSTAAATARLAAAGAGDHVSTFW